MDDETPITPTPDYTTQQPPISNQEMEKRQRNMIIGLVVVAVLLVVAVIGSTIYLLQPTTNTMKIRDIFIIWMALESMLLTLVLIVLVIQLARLINLLQNEVKPILESTNETVSYLRGTSTFLSNNMVEPVMKMNEYLAGLTQLLFVLRVTKKPPKSKPSNPSKGE
jgi:DMSO reductase anchor subunit